MEKCIDCGKLFEPYIVEDMCHVCGGDGGLGWREPCRACGGSGENQFTEKMRCENCFDIHWQRYDDDDDFY